MAGPKAKDLGSITGGSGRDADCDWPNAVVIGPKTKDVGGTGAEAEIGPSFPCDAVGSKMAVGVGSGMRGVDSSWWMAGGATRLGDRDNGVMPVGTSNPFAFPEIGANGPTMLIGVGVGCDEGDVMPVGASAPYAILELADRFHVMLAGQQWFTMRTS